MRKPLSPECQALLESIAGVLSQHGLCITRESNTQYPLLGNDLDKVLREMSRNGMQSVLLVQDEQALAEDNERIEQMRHTHVIGGGM